MITAQLIMALTILSCGILVFTTFCMRELGPLVRTAQIGAALTAVTLVAYVPFASCYTTQEGELLKSKVRTHRYFYNV